MNERFKCVEDLVLTDYRNGVLEDPATGQFVPATESARTIAAHFETPALWSEFEGRDAPGATDLFQEMRSLGLIVPEAEMRTPPTEHGPTTMFDAPRRRLDEITSGEIVFLGAPIDIGVTGVPGARFGPTALREASVERYRAVLDLNGGGIVPWNVPSLGGAVLGGARLSDAGDVAYMPGEPHDAYYQRLRHAVQAIYQAGAFPIVLGGDHSITYATVPEVPADLIHIDAHSDLAELRDGHAHHHGNVLSRLVAEKRIGALHQFGLRCTSGRDSSDAKAHVAAIGDLELAGWSDGIAGTAPFVSLDIDVLDPSVAPGTGTPVIGGLSLRQLCQILAEIAARSRPVGLDIVELCPLQDPSDTTARAAIEAILCFMAVLHDTHW